MTIEPAGATLGATVCGVDLRSLSDDEWAAVHEAFLRHAVLVFPGQHLDDEAQIAFSERFGSLERLITSGVRDPRIGYLANVNGAGEVVEPKGKVALFLLGNTFWHSDSSFKPVPAKASLLSARVMPPTGGETEWADMRAAYDALPASRRAELDGAVAVHDYLYSQGLIGGLDVMTTEEQQALPPVEHPVVRVHPETGRPSLFVGRHCSHLVGHDVETSRRLLADLVDEACQPPRVFTHRWTPGDLAVWDNRCVLHRGRTWPVDQPRVMARTTVAGDGDNPWALPPKP
jgi:alpha-ketoglutarate-dependent taurine dioxygenase